MKKIFIPALLLFYSITTFAQSQHQTHTHPIDARLYEVFDGTYLEQLNAENPFLIQRMNFYLDHAWYITDLPAEKAKTEYPRIEIENLEKMNILLLERSQKMQRDWDKQTVYKIGDSGKALVFLPGKEFTKKLNEHLAQQ